MNKNLNRIIALLAVGLLWIIEVQGQNSANTSGSHFTGSTGTVSYSVGQVVYTSNIGTNGSVSQGVQQGYEISTIGINKTSLKIAFSVYPNPTADNLTLKISDYGNEKLFYQLRNMKGQLLINGQIVAQQTQINMSSLPSATYFAHVVDSENKKIQSFKIIKK